MTAEQATFLRDYACQSFAIEAETTKKVIGAMTPGNENYKPSDRCQTGIGLAGHIATSDIWFLNSIADGAFAPPSGDGPKPPETIDDVLAYYNENLPKAFDRIKAIPADKLAEPLDFFGMMKMPTASFVDLAMRHSIHHRGQLSAYLRAMGGKVPGIYGPSGDSKQASA